MILEFPSLQELKKFEKKIGSSSFKLVNLEFNPETKTWIATFKKVK
jgi:hypothetical protein